MKIQTTRFGVVDVSDAAVITFPEGLPGFSDLKRYAVIEEAATKPFRWLQSCEMPALAFFVVDPAAFFPDYVPEMKQSDLAPLEIEGGGRASVLVTVTIGANPAESTANLRGPILVNESKKLGKQVILEDPRHATKQRLL